MKNSVCSFPEALPIPVGRHALAVLELAAERLSALEAGVLGDFLERLVRVREEFFRVRELEVEQELCEADAHALIYYPLALAR